MFASNCEPDAERSLYVWCRVDVGLEMRELPQVFLGKLVGLVSESRQSNYWGEE